MKIKSIPEGIVRSNGLTFRPFRTHLPLAPWPVVYMAIDLTGMVFKTILTDGLIKGGTTKEDIEERLRGALTGNVDFEWERDVALREWECVAIVPIIKAEAVEI